MSEPKPMSTEAEIMARIYKHTERITMYSRILQVYKMPLLSFKEIRQLEAKIMAEYGA